MRILRQLKKSHTVTLMLQTVAKMSHPPVKGKNHRDKFIALKLPLGILCAVWCRLLPRLSVTPICLIPSAELGIIIKSYPSFKDGTWVPLGATASWRVFWSSVSDTLSPYCLTVAPMPKFSFCRRLNSRYQYAGQTALSLQAVKKSALNIIIVAARRNKWKTWATKRFPEIGLRTNKFHRLDFLWWQI